MPHFCRIDDCWQELGISPPVVVFDGTHTWVCDKGGNTLTEIDPSTGATLQTVTGFNNPQSLAFDGTNLWVGSNPSSLFKVSTSGAILATYSVGARLSSLTFDGVNLWGTFDQNGQAVEISTSTGSILNTYSTGTQQKASVFDVTTCGRLTRSAHPLRKSRFGSYTHSTGGTTAEWNRASDIVWPFSRQHS